MFGSSSSNSNGFNALNSNQQNFQNIPEAAMPWWLRELIFIQSAYSTGNGSSLCTYMYDKIPNELKIIALSAPLAYEKLKEERKHAFLKLHPWLDERQWNMADKSCPQGFLPTPVIGIKGLDDRVKAQIMELNDQMNMLRANSEESPEISKSWLDTLKSQASSQIEKTISKCKIEQKNLEDRFIKIVGKAEQLLSLVSNKSMTKTEADFHDTIISKRERLKILTKNIVKLRKNIESHHDDIEERVMEESKIIQVSSLHKDKEKEMKVFINDQQSAIYQLLQVVKKDLRDITAMKAEFESKISK